MLRVRIKMESALNVSFDYYKTQLPHNNLKFDCQEIHKLTFIVACATSAPTPLLDNTQSVKSRTEAYCTMKLKVYVTCNLILLVVEGTSYMFRYIIDL